MIYAQILAGVVVNIISLNDASLVSQFTVGFDALVEIDQLNPQPQIGYLYDGTNFTPSALPNDAYGNEVVLVTSAAPTDVYSAGGINYSFTHGTPLNAVYLSLAIQQNIVIFQAAAMAFVTGKYTLDTRWMFLALYFTATQSGLTNRAAYVFQLLTWGQSVTAYCSSYVLTVKAMTNPTLVAAKVADFTQVAVPDPLITTIAALAIVT